MNWKNRDIVAFINSITEIRKKRLPVKLGFAISKNVKNMTPAAEAYEEERKKILEKYAEKKNGSFVIEDDKFVIRDKQGYEKDMAELLDIDTEVNIQMVSFLEVEKCDQEKFDSLTVAEIGTLECMIE